MTNKEIVLGVMEKHPCVTSAQIHNYALQMFHENITPQTASSILRAGTGRGLVNQSKHPFTGKAVYWLTEKGKKEFL